MDEVVNNGQRDPSPLISEPLPLPASAPVVAVSTESAAPIAPPAPEFRDRSTGLVVFGVVQIVLGGLTALMIPLAVLGAFLTRLAPGGGGMRPMQVVASVGTYAGLAAVLITLGIGSAQKKRWARALTVVLSWYWLIVGILITILLTAALPVAMRTALAQAQRNTDATANEISTGIMAVMVTVMIVFCAFFLIVAPIGLLVFYSRQDVADTCRYRDPIERWTDRTPLPVLGASVVLFVGAAYLLLVGLTTPVFPFFGQYLTGVAGAVCFLVYGALDLYLSYAIYHRKLSGWWIAVITSPVRLLSMILTYARADLMQAYSRMGWSEAQLRVLNSNPMFRSHVILWWSLISVFLFLGYLIWLRRYFKPPNEMHPSPLPSQVPELSGR
ncbi:MAG TPA: hypothetical protein VMH04_11710 [Candidatus Solibacter sp.]|nr:hypothetical protein [Candidatus Solibacter sp.]